VLVNQCHKPKPISVRGSADFIFSIVQSC